MAASDGTYPMIVRNDQTGYFAHLEERAVSGSK